MRASCVCVPARNEAERLPVLIAALAAQDMAHPVRLALCINNSTDGTVEAAIAAVQRCEGRVSLRMVQCDFPPECAHAGSARKAAMDLGAAWLADDDALLISTDADCRPPETWLSANLACAAPQAIIGGRIALDEAEADQWPALFALRRRFDAYWRKVRAIEDDVDLLPWDPPPRHGDDTGASLALTIGLYRAAGGVPVLPSGEDRALVDAAVAAGGKLIHPQQVWTRTSARPVGRASGGMAQEMQVWLAGDPPKVPAYRHWHCRALWRRSMRPLLEPARLVAAERRLPPMPCDMVLPRATPA